MNSSGQFSPPCYFYHDPNPNSNTTQPQPQLLLVLTQKWLCIPPPPTVGQNQRTQYLYYINLWKLTNQKVLNIEKFKFLPHFHVFKDFLYNAFRYFLCFQIALTPSIFELEKFLRCQNFARNWLVMFSVSYASKNAHSAIKNSGVLRVGASGAKRCYLLTHCAPPPKFYPGTSVSSCPQRIPSPTSCLMVIENFGFGPSPPNQLM